MTSTQYIHKQIVTTFEAIQRQGVYSNFTCNAVEYAITRSTASSYDTNAINAIIHHLAVKFYKDLGMEEDQICSAFIDQLVVEKSKTPKLSHVIHDARVRDVRKMWVHWVIEELKHE